MGPVTLAEMPEVTCSDCAVSLSSRIKGPSIFPSGAMWAAMLMIECLTTLNCGAVNRTPGALSRELN